MRPSTISLIFSIFVTMMTLTIIYGIMINRNPTIYEWIFMIFAFSIFNILQWNNYIKELRLEEFDKWFKEEIS